MPSETDHRKMIQELGEKLAKANRDPWIAETHVGGGVFAGSAPARGGDADWDETYVVVPRCQSDNEVGTYTQTNDRVAIAALHNHAETLLALAQESVDSRERAANPKVFLDKARAIVDDFVREDDGHDDRVGDRDGLVKAVAVALAQEGLEARGVVAAARDVAHDCHMKDIGCDRLDAAIAAYDALASNQIGDKR